MQAEQRSERELFQAYLKECDECCIVPDVGGAFHAGYSAALSHPSPQGWVSVHDALPPDREMVAVGWMDVEDHDEGHRYSIDFIEEGVWQFFFNEHEHYLIAGVAKGRSEDAPYTHWQRIGRLAPPPEQGSKG